ncbi:MAG TPA: DUF2608 domain-containing protein [Rhabdochlamydiaceae bacterium]|nr:DUF2608 domain-containing protein [Rhabdochlamydiaceae bacterium]
MIYKILAALFLSANLAYAAIVEIDHFNELPDYVDEKTLLLLDIDDTLIIPRQALGTDIWLLDRANQYKNSGLNPSAAFEKALSEWEAVRLLTKVKLVEEDTASVIQELQKKGVSMMGITAQGLALATRTLKQLGELGIDLQQAAPTQDDLYFFSENHGMLFRKGIFFLAGKSKGKSFLTFLDRLRIRPERVVLIDDKLSTLTEMEQALDAEHIPFVGLRYSFSDARIKAFNPQIADIQFHPFSTILSDEEAQSLLQ